MKKIAILFLVHKSPEQLSRLLRHLDDERFDFYIHVDAKSDINDFLPIESQVRSSQIHWIKNRVKTYFNDFSLVEATYSAMKDAFTVGEYLYYILLTGQDYPIKSNDTIYRELLESYPISFIDMYGVDEACSAGVEWVERIGYNYFSQSLRKWLLNLVGNKFYYSKKGRIIKVIPKAYDKIMTILHNSPRKEIQQLGYKYSAGSHFWILPDVSVRLIIDRYEYDKKINRIFHHIAAPEESYFQTILSSLPSLQLPKGMLEQFGNADKEMDNPALRLIKWYENGVHTNGHPAIWTIDDKQTIDNAKALFARKFDVSIDSKILDYLDLKK